MANKNKKLTPKEQLFVEALLTDENMTAGEAAIKAGYVCKSNVVANSMGYTVKNRPHVAAAIAAAMQDRMDKVGVDAAKVLQRLDEEWVADIAELYDDKGKFLPVRSWPKVFRRGLVTKIKYHKDGEIEEVHLANRDKTKEMVGKHINVQAFKESIVLTEKRVVVRDLTGESNDGI